MKTLKQFMEESAHTPGTFKHFNHHLGQFSKHEAAACRIEDSRRGLGDSTAHWDAAEEHENELTKHYGSDVMDKINNGRHDHSSAAGRKAAWDDVTKQVKESTQPVRKKSLRLAAENGMGTHTKAQARAAVGEDVDYFKPKTGEKRSGTITHVAHSHYIVTDEDTQAEHKFAFYNKKKHQEMED